jgi:hypothetical protein
MANFYWLGSRNSNVMSNLNWSMIDPETLIGLTGTTGSLPWATRTPSTDDSVIFDKFEIQGTTFVYPLFAPTGTMGVSGGGATAALLTRITIMGDYHKGIGTGVGFTQGAFLNCFARYIYLTKDITNGSTFAYNFNLLPFGITNINAVNACSLVALGGATSNFNINANNLPSAMNLYIKGTGNIQGNYNSGTQFSHGNINIDSFKGKVALYNHKGYEKLYVTAGVTLSDYDNNLGGTIFVGGFGNSVNIEKGFGAGATATIELSGGPTQNDYGGKQGATLVQELIFTPVSWSGISGGITGPTTKRTKVSIATQGAAYSEIPGNNKQQISVYHPIDISYLQMESGNMRFNYTGAGSGSQANIFEGSISTEASIHMTRYNTVTMYPPNDYNTNPNLPRGFGVQVINRDAFPGRKFPIVIGNNMQNNVLFTVALSNDSSFWEGLYRDSNQLIALQADYE